MAQLKQTFRPEFLNRIDAMIVFHSLTQEQIRQIVDLELTRVRKQLAEQEITLEVTTEAMDLLGERGYDHTYGARPLRRIIQNLIEDPLAEGLLDSRFQAGSHGPRRRRGRSAQARAGQVEPESWRASRSTRQHRTSDDAEGAATWPPRLVVSHRSQRLEVMAEWPKSNELRLPAVRRHQPGLPGPLPRLRRLELDGRDDRGAASRPDRGARPAGGRTGRSR